MTAGSNPKICRWVKPSGASTGILFVTATVLLMLSAFVPNGALTKEPILPVICWKIRPMFGSSDR